MLPSEALFAGAAGSQNAAALGGLSSPCPAQNSVSPFKNIS